MIVAEGLFPRPLESVANAVVEIPTGKQCRAKLVNKRTVETNGKGEELARL